MGINDLSFFFFNPLVRAPPCGFRFHVHVQYAAITASVAYLVELLLCDVWFVLGT